LSPTFGDWSRDTVRLDFDNTPLKKVKFWGFMVCKYFHLEGFVILCSSVKKHVVKIRNQIVYSYSEVSYLVIFNRKVKWNLNVKIMDWVARLSEIQSLMYYVLMQGIKRSSTVRCGSKGKKPSPKVVFCFGKQDGQIEQFLETRNLIKKFENENKKTPILGVESWFGRTVAMSV